MLENSAKFNIHEIIAHFGESSVKNLSNEWECKGVSTDSRFIKNGVLFIALRGENTDGHNYIEKSLANGASAVMVDFKWYKEHLNEIGDSPFIIVKDTLKALGSLANIHRRRFNIPIIAIGGSNGKTTTKNMTANILSQKYKVLKTFKNYNNQIGVPWMLLQLNDDYDIAVIEIGTNEPGEILILSNMLEPTHGLITNIGKEHLEKLGDIDGVEIEEAYLFGFLYKNSGTCFINIDDERLIKYKIILDNGITYGTDKEALFQADIKLDYNVHPIIKFSAESSEFTAKMQTVGNASALNAIASAAIGFHFKLSDTEIISGLEGFKQDYGQGYGRMLVEIINNVTIINDCYNANPESMKEALNTLQSFKTDGKKIAVLADMLELGETSLEEHKAVLGIALSSADYIFISGKEMLKANEDYKKNDKILFVDDKNDIIDKLNDILKSNDVLLIKGSRGMRLEEVINGIRNQNLK